MNKKILLTAWVVASFSACTIYQPLVITDNAIFLNDVSHISVDRSTLSLPELKSHTFDASDGLDMTEVAMLAVINSPDLRLARDQANVSRAQAFASGLLPDPQISYSVDKPTNAPDEQNAKSYGISYDINALLTLYSARKAADAGVRQADLDILWQEWQVVSQARMMFSRLVSARKILTLLRAEEAISSSRYQRMLKALNEGNVAADAVATDLASLQTIQASVHDKTREIIRAEGALNTLLGLKADVELKLVGDEQLPALDSAKIDAALKNLPQRRPDLLALKAGYESQEEKFRQSVLAQFPTLNVGITRSTDNAGLKTSGIGVTLSLPIFNRNRGNVAIEQATRQKLHDEYQSRLNTALTDITAITSEQPIDEKQLAEAQSGEALLAKAANASESAFRAGSIDSLAYANLRNAWLAKQTEVLNLKQHITEARIALLAFVGGDITTCEDCK